VQTVSLRGNQRQVFGQRTWWSTVGSELYLFDPVNHGLLQARIASADRDDKPHHAGNLLKRSVHLSARGIDFEAEAACAEALASENRHDLRDVDAVHETPP
jgi:hypothetical protein